MDADTLKQSCDRIFLSWNRKFGSSNEEFAIYGYELNLLTEMTALADFAARSDQAHDFSALAGWIAKVPGELKSDTPSVALSEIVTALRAATGIKRIEPADYTDVGFGLRKSPAMSAAAAAAQT